MEIFFVYEYDYCFLSMIIDIKQKRELFEEIKHVARILQTRQILFFHLQTTFQGYLGPSSLYCIPGMGRSQDRVSLFQVIFLSI
jgi:hypothetical protein